MTTRVIGHRGACLVAPENTVASALAAARLGADIVELDVRESADGVLYLMHDATVDRTTDGAGEIARLASAEIDALDAGAWFGPAFAGERVPRLDAFLAAIRDGLDIYVDVKACDLDRLGRAIGEAALDRRCLVYSEEPGVRTELRRRLPHLPRMANWRRDLADLRDAVVQEARVVEFDAPDFAPDRVAEARALGLEVMIHTTERAPALFAAARRAGVDYLNVDYVAEAARPLSSEDTGRTAS